MNEAERVFNYISSAQYPLQEEDFVGVVFVSDLEVRLAVLSKIKEEWWKSCAVSRSVVRFKNSLLYIDVVENNHCQNYGGMEITTILYSREAERKVEGINHREYMRTRLRSPCKAAHVMSVI